MASEASRSNLYCQVNSTVPSGLRRRAKATAWKWWSAGSRRGGHRAFASRYDPALRIVSVDRHGDGHRK
jgi:hypothetical protein